MLVVAHLAEWSAFRRSDFGIGSVTEGASRRVPRSGFGLAKLPVTKGSSCSRTRHDFWLHWVFHFQSFSN
jgi:hypothetical protein